MPPQYFFASAAHDPKFFLLVFGILIMIPFYQSVGISPTNSIQFDLISNKVLQSVLQSLLVVE